MAIPIKMFNATSPSSGIIFNLIHRACGSRIKKENVCSVCNKPVTDIIKGYKSGENYILVTDEEIRNFRKKATGEMKIFAFVKKNEIAPIHISGTYYVLPDGKVGKEAFPLFFAALQAQDRIGIAKTIISGKEVLLALHANKDVMMAYKLFFAEELKSPKEFTIEVPEVDKISLKMVETLVKSLSCDFSYEEFKDEHTEEIRNFLKAKAEGGVSAEADVAEEASNFLDSLRASIETLEKPEEGEVKTVEVSSKNEL